MRIILSMISTTPEFFRHAAETAFKNATGPISLYGFGNGVVLDPERQNFEWQLRKFESVLLRSQTQNIGVPGGFHQLWDMSRAPIASYPDDILVQIHDDVEILEPGWDARIKRCFREHPGCGLAGFGGSTAVAGDEIYKVPYEIHQLGRRNFYSNMVDAETHGFRATEERPIVWTDGFSIILKRELLNKIGGWSWWPPECLHHAYDYGIACMARRHGYEAWLVPCAVNHRGAQASTNSIHKEVVERFGGEEEIHRSSHAFVYNEFRDVLPLRLP